MNVPLGPWLAASSPPPSVHHHPTSTRCTGMRRRGAGSWRAWRSRSRRRWRVRRGKTRRRAEEVAGHQTRLARQRGVARGTVLTHHAFLGRSMQRQQRCPRRRDSSALQHADALMGEIQLSWIIQLILSNRIQR